MLPNPLNEALHIWPCVGSLEPSFFSSGALQRKYGSRDHITYVAGGHQG